MIPGVNLASLGALIQAQTQGRLTGEWLPLEAEALGEMGASHIEVHTDGLFVFPPCFSERAVATLAALRGQASFSVHLPYLFADLSSLNEPVRRASLECIRRAVEVSEPLGPAAYVLHLTSPRGDHFLARPNAGERQRALARRLLQDQAARTLDELLPHVQPGKLCVENLVERLPFDRVRSLVERFDLSICFDVDHWAAQEGDWEGALQELYPRIREVHIHLETCLAGLEGRPERVDVHRLVALLEAEGYAGTVVIEAGGQRRAIARALGVLRRLTEERL